MGKTALVYFCLILCYVVASQAQERNRGGCPPLDPNHACHDNEGECILLTFSGSSFTLFVKEEDDYGL